MRTAMIAWALAAFAAHGCGDDDGGGGDAGTDTDTDADGGGTLGAIDLTGNWDGAIPDGATFKTAVFECPFTMPPTYSDLDGTINLDTGDVHGLVEGIEPGTWCLMAYLDMDPDDGLAPVAGLDAVNATGAENENGAIAVDVVAGEVVPIELVFEMM
jgi:hypothetical protein